MANAAPGRRTTSIPRTPGTSRATGRPAKLVVDGRAVEGTLVPYAPAGKVVTIACEV